MKNTARSPAQTPFQRFTEFAKRVMSVPKAEIDEQAKRYRQQRKRKRKKA